jgi:hypothetical protein
MNKTHLETFVKGIISPLIFGAYCRYIFNKIKLNNENIENQHKKEIIDMENQHKKEIIEMKNQHKLLNEKLEKLEKVVSKQKSWF